MAVYVIRNMTSGLLKIGTALDPVKRLAGLQTGAADQLKLVLLFEGGRAEERTFHRVFSAHRTRGEWFKVTAKQIMDCGHDLVELPVPSPIKVRRMVETNRGRALTSAERQSKRREQYRVMKAAIEDISDARSLRQAQAIARTALGI